MSLEHPGDLSGATHEFDYLVRSINDRYNLGYSAYDLFYEALRDGQVSYDASTGAFSNRASWYIDADHHMVAGGNGVPYRFATQAEISALTAGAGSSDLPDDTSAETAERIEAAREAGATAVCETYLYIGNLPNFYTGGDVALYDFYIAVETDLSTGVQTVYASIPSDAVPAFRADVTLDADGSATVALDDVEAVSPVRLVFEVAPREEVRDVLARMQAGGALTKDELTEMLGGAGVENADGDLAVAALAYGGADGADAASQPLVTTALTGNAAPGSAYVVGSDTPLYTLAAGVEVAKGELPQASELAPLTSEPVAGRTYYYLETTYSARFSSVSTAAPATATKTVRRYVASGDTGASAWRVGDNGQYELIAGSPAMPTGTIAVVNAKAQNRTGTLPYTQELRGDMSGDALVLTANLGNNGAYVFEVASEEPEPDPGTDPEPGGGEEPGDGGTTQPDDGEGGNHGGSGNDGDSDGRPGSDKGSSEGAKSDSGALVSTDGTRAAKLTITLAIFGSAACLVGIVLMTARKIRR